MQAVRNLLLSVLLCIWPASAVFAQDAAVLRSPATTSPLHPAVALEQRIIGHIDALGITGEQEPPFRVAMQQVAALEAGEGATLSHEDLLARIVGIVAKVLYSTQVAEFRERELARMGAIP
jgi:hypothetical protein